jgi:hypothetical protein
VDRTYILKFLRLRKAFVPSPRSYTGQFFA